MNGLWIGEFSPTTTLQDIFYCFRLILGRLPEEKEWPGHSSRVGEPLCDVAATYLNSQEFHNRGLMKPAGPQRLEFAALDGFGMFASPDDIAVGKHLLWLKDYEPHVSQPFRKYLKPGMRVLDIGANIGFYSLLSASRVGPAGEVIAVEPNPANVRLILNSIERNGFRSLRVIQAAAYNAWAPLELFTDSSNGSVVSLGFGSESPTTQTVMGLPLKAVVGDAPVHLVKVDVEGAEGRALEGMWDAVTRWKPVIFSEFTPNLMPTMSCMSAEQYLQQFLSVGYNISVLDPAAGRIDCGRDSGRVMKAFEVASDTHLDLLFEHP